MKDISKEKECREAIAFLEHLEKEKFTAVEVEKTIRYADQILRYCRAKQIKELPYTVNIEEGELNTVILPIPRL